MRGENWALGGAIGAGVRGEGSPPAGREEDTAHDVEAQDWFVTSSSCGSYGLLPPGGAAIWCREAGSGGGAAQTPLDFCQGGIEFLGQHWVQGRSEKGKRMCPCAKDTFNRISMYEKDTNRCLLQGISVSDETQGVQAEWVVRRNRGAADSESG